MARRSDSASKVKAVPAELVNPEGCVLDGLVQLDVSPDLLLQRLEGRLPIDKWNRVETLVPPRAEEGESSKTRAGFLPSFRTEIFSTISLRVTRLISATARSTY